MEKTPEGVVVSNSLDNTIFFLRNYPYNVPEKSVIHVFAIESGFYSYSDKSGGPQTVHAYDYGVPYNPGSEKKPATGKANIPSVKQTAPPEPTNK